MTLVLLFCLLPSIITKDIFAASVITDASSFAQTQNLKFDSRPSSSVSYSTSGNIVTELFSSADLPIADALGTQESELGYNTYKFSFPSMSYNDSIIVTYNNIGEYDGRDIGCKATYYDFETSTSIKTPYIKISTSFYCGYQYYYINNLKIKYEFFYVDSGEFINIENSYMTFNSLNEGEFVSYLNNNNQDGYAVETTNIITKQLLLYARNYNVYIGNTNEFEDLLGADTFTNNSISIPISGREINFIVGCTNRSIDPNTPNAVNNSTWNTPSAAPLVLVIPESPQKTVNNSNSCESLIGSTITYKVSQKMHTLGENILIKYNSLVFEDTLPIEVTYVNATMTCNNTIVNAGTLTYDSANHKVSYTFSSDYLKNTMAYNGETYTLTITCTVNTNARPGVSFTNQGKVLFNDIPNISNTVSTIPVYKITTEVINGTITPSIFNIHGGSNKTISYSPNPGYMIQSVTVDGVAQSITSFPDYYTFSNISADHHIKVVYEPIPNKTITITKIWDDRNNEYNTRPSSLKINILQNGSVFSNVVMTNSNAISTDSNKWTITTTVPERDQYRNILTYTIEEDTTNVNLRYFYETPVYDQSKLTVTNTAQFIPTSSNEHPEYKIIVHKDIIDENKNIADSEDFEQVALDINDTYNFAITLKELNRQVTNTGTSLVESYNGYSGNVFNGIVTNKGDLIFNLGDEGYGKYEISENVNQYFDFVDIEKLNDEFNTSGASFSKENGKYYITLSGITGEFEQISVKVTNQIKPDRPYNKTEDKENLFKI